MIRNESILAFFFFLCCSVVGSGLLCCASVCLSLQRRPDRRRSSRGADEHSTHLDRGKPAGPRRKCTLQFVREFPRTIQPTADEKNCDNAKFKLCNVSHYSHTRIALLWDTEVSHVLLCKKKGGGGAWGNNTFTRSYLVKYSKYTRI